MYPLTLTFTITLQDPAQLAAVLAGVGATAGATPIQALESTAEKPAEPKTEKPKREKVERLAVPVDEPEASTEPAAEIPYQAVMDAVLALVKAKGREAAAAVLASFGVAKAPDLAKEKYGAVIEACKAEI